MFFNLQNIEKKDEYINLLSIVGSLSNLFSDSSTPYLYYRIAEKIFCKAFNAEDLSRSDVSVDARSIDSSVGIGLKTFIAGNYSTFQKIAEFNHASESYKALKGKKLIEQIAKLRNERLKFTINAHDLNNLLYHCVIRDNNRFCLYEEEMKYIDIDKINNVKTKSTSISFDDGQNEYSFLISKSTLTKRFNISNIIEEFEVKIIDEPLEELKKYFRQQQFSFQSNPDIIKSIYLPLYGSGNKVAQRSGLNHWNASGRSRDPNEVYIPIPRIIHLNEPDFFPSRDHHFTLKLPNGGTMKAKVCQDNSKALMSCPNKALGKWLLREVLALNKGELLTYEKLRVIGIDSVRIDKISDEVFEINFAQVGSYERFIKNF